MRTLHCESRDALYPGWTSFRHLGYRPEFKLSPGEANFLNHQSKNFLCPELTAYLILKWSYRPDQGVNKIRTPNIARLRHGVPVPILKLHWYPR
jgi:hypothetical protein